MLLLRISRARKPAAELRGVRKRKNKRWHWCREAWIIGVKIPFMSERQTGLIFHEYPKKNKSHFLQLWKRGYSAMLLLFWCKRERKFFISPSRYFSRLRTQKGGWGLQQHTPHSVQSNQQIVTRSLQPLVKTLIFYLQPFTFNPFSPKQL